MIVDAVLSQWLFHNVYNFFHIMTLQYNLMCDHIYLSLLLQTAALYCLTGCVTSRSTNYSGSVAFFHISSGISGHISLTSALV
jgi:hypothetical protein